MALLRALLAGGRHLASLCTGSAVAIGAALHLATGPQPWKPAWLGAAVLVALSGSSLWCAWKRWAARHTGSARGLELQLGLHLSVLVYSGIELLPGSIDGPFQPLSYLALCLLAAWLSAPVLVWVLFVMVALEASLARLHGLGLVTFSVHAALLCGFAGLGWAILQVEVLRARRLSRDRLERELGRIKETARSYRLAGARGGGAPWAEEAGLSNDQETLVRSSVEHLRVLLRFMLDLLRRALQLRSAALLWVDQGQGERVLRLHVVSSDVADLESGPFDAQSGVIAVGLSSREPILIPEQKAHGRMPIYRDAVDATMIGVCPLLEQDEPVGVLLVDSRSGTTLDAEASAALEEAGRFVLGLVQSERLLLQLERTRSEQGKLYHAADALSKARTEREVIEAGVFSARAFAAFDFAAVTLLHSDRRHEVCAASGEGVDHLVGQYFSDPRSLVEMVVENRHPLPYQGQYHPRRQMVFSPELPVADFESLIVLPLMVHESVLGTLVLGSQQHDAFGESVTPLLQILSQHVAVSLANARMVKRLEDLATSDGMTGLLNKRALIEVADQKLRSSQRFSKPLSVIIADIDHFKRVNDSYGHDIGDVVIRGFADVLKRTKRETDSVARFGGEEFVVLCEETDATGARLLAERVRQELEAAVFHTPKGPLQVTCSLGVATFPAAGHDWSGLFKATDEALYVSKRSGRNRVSVWTSSRRGAA